MRHGVGELRRSRWAPWASGGGGSPATGVAVATAFLGAVVNGWRLLNGGPLVPTAHLLAAVALVGVAMGLHHRVHRAWFLGVAVTGADAMHILSTASPGLLGSMIWPLVGAGVLITPAVPRGVVGNESTGVIFSVGAAARQPASRSFVLVPTSSVSALS